MHQFDRYFGLSNVETVICGFSELPTPLQLPGYKFYSIGKFKAYPAKKWSDALINVLDNVAAEVFILMLEDYWLSRPTDKKAIWMIYDYMLQFQNVVKFDLTDERLYSGTPPEGYNQFYWGFNTYDTLGYLDLIKSDPASQYHMSLWGGMWRRDLLRELIVPGETAQQIEMSDRIYKHPEWLVLGTRQCPMLHINAVQRGAWNPHERTGLPGLKSTDREELRERGYLSGLDTA